MAIDFGDGQGASAAQTAIRPSQQRGQRPPCEPVNFFLSFIQLCVPRIR